MQYAPDEEELGSDFIAWLKKGFGWLFNRAQQNATLGDSYVYADGQLPEWALLGEYGNGGSKSVGRLEYLWLPTEDGNAIPIGLYRNNRFYAIHPDHLGTPRLITDDANQPVWQWPYSAFGANKPTGVLEATQKPKQAFTNEPVLLKATRPQIGFNLRYPGQYFDEESNLNYNYQRSYQATQGRYTQGDPIGLGGGNNRYAYACNNPFDFIDPKGLAYFAKRPLAGLPWLGSLSNNPLDDYFNTEISHEQLFFEDSKSPANLGFFDDGMLKTEPNPTGFRARSGKYSEVLVRGRSQCHPPTL